jgi:CDP-glucose 4,6-dehydratase
VDRWEGALEGMVKMNRSPGLEVYKGRDVLITGHTGFKGGWLALWLDSIGAKVHGLSLDPPTDPSFFHAAGIDRSVEWTRGDIRDPATIGKAFSESNPEIVFHLAAQPIVRESYADPIGTFETNVIGTVNVLEAVRHFPGIRGCLCITSDKCYENPENGLAFKESDPLGGSDPYSASKGAAEIAISSYRKSFFAKSETIIASARAGNVIGGGDWAKDRLLPDCIRYLQRKESIIIRAPKAVRPWQHVLDPLSGYLRLGAMMLDGDRDAEGAWNFGPPERKETTVEELVRMIVEEWGEGQWKTEATNENRKESSCLRLDSTKANKSIGWTCEWNVREAVRRSVDWYRRHADGGDMRKYSLGQISAHQHDSEG